MKKFVIKNRTREGKLNEIFLDLQPPIKKNMAF